MNKIKDFFYDKNDILVALIILAAAAFIIYIRIGDIMAYPNTLVETTAASSETTAAAQTTAATTAPAAVPPVSITISDDAISITVSKQLADAGLVPSADVFETALKKYNMTSSIRSGTFSIPADATNEQIIEIITGKKLS